MVNIDIAIIEGNPHLRSLLGWHLQQAGYNIQQASSIQQGKHLCLEQQPDLVVLDSDLSDSDGLELCHWLFTQHRSLVLMLSSRTQEKDVVTALKSGADDYLKKPFGMQELMARVDALVRRIRVNSAPLFLEYGDLHIDLVQRRVQFQGSYIDLTPQEFSLLYVLAQAQGNPLSRSELLRRAWPDAIDNPRTIDTHVLSLRKKIETNPRKPNLIQTVRNIGYQFNQEAVQTEKITPVNITSHVQNNGHFKAELISS
jgi:two-component system OmpR family response regulator